jgi:predicted transcriptional regulator
MELETLFTASKWEILKLLSEQPLSPLQIAERSSTSLANVSQQLRLLEMAGLVKSERISNRDKGQPRILYSLAGDQSYLIATTSDFVEKKLFQLSAYNKVILRIWFYEDPNIRYVLEKAFWQIEQHLPNIERLSVLGVTGKRILLCVESKLPADAFEEMTLTNLTGDEVTIAFDRTNSCEESHLLYSK